MVGEAAHVITPFAGTGVNARLQDALQLSQALTDGECTDVLSAMKRYEDAMHTYAADTQCCGFGSMMGLREEWAQGLTPEQFVAAASRMRTKLENYRSFRERVYHCTKWVPRAPGLCAMQLMAGDKVGTVGSRFKMPEYVRKYAPAEVCHWQQNSHISRAPHVSIHDAQIACYRNTKWLIIAILANLAESTGRLRCPQCSAEAVQPWQSGEDETARR